MSAAELYLTGVGLCCSLGATAGASRDAYRRNIPAFRKAVDLVGIDGFAPTLAALIPIADCRDYPQRLGRLLAWARDDFKRMDDGRIPNSIHVLLPPWIEAHSIRQKVAAAVLDVFGSTSPRPTLAFGGPTLFLNLLSAVAGQVGPDYVTLVAAVDSFIDAGLLDALAAHGRMLFHGNPYGCVPSEAAVIMRVADRPTVTGLRVVGIKQGRETEDVRAPQGPIGRGLAAVLRQTAALIGDDQRIGRLMIGLTGERWRAEECGFALSAGGSFLADLTGSFEAPLSIVGDCGVASTAVMLALAIADLETAEHRENQRTLVVDSSRSGERAACVVEPVREVA